jgi:flagellin-like hook-associated protein FlgL
VNGEYLFSGAATQTKPFVVTSTNAQGNPLTIAYQGSTDTTAATVNQNEAVSMNASGRDIFQNPSTNQPGGYDAFQVLIALRDTLRNTTMSSHDQELAISSLAGDIDRVNTNITTATGKQSAVLQNLSQLKTNLEDMQLSVKQTISNLGDTDLSQVVVQLQAQQTMMQLSFYGLSKMLNQSLLDFLK